MAAWRPPKRLRQLECTSGRGLLLGSGSKGSPPAAHYISIAARLSGGGGGATPSAHAATDAADASTGWRLVYRSEVTGGTSNPEWRPLGWSDAQLLQADPLVHSSEVQVLLSLHALEPGADAGAGLLAHPLLFDAASRPALDLPAALGSSSAEEGGAVAAAAAAEPTAAVAAEPAAPAAGAAEQQLPDGQPSPAAEPSSDQQQQNGVHSLVTASADEQQPKQEQQQAAKQSAAAVADSPAAAAAAAPEPSSPPDWAAAVADALAGTGCCPGRLVAAWHLDSLEALFPAGHDLAALRQSLQPDTLVLSFPDGAFLCPPPLEPTAAAAQAAAAAAAAAQRGSEVGSAPPSLLASPLKSRLPSMAGEDAPAARRGLASLLVSKLLRSAPNLQDGAAVLGSDDYIVLAGAGGGGGLSDAESDAGSDATGATGVTAASRLTTLTATGELQAAAAAGEAQAAAVAAAAPAPAAGMSSSKPLTLASAYQCVSSIAAMQTRLRDLAGRSQALQHRLEQLLQPEQQRRQQAAALAAAAAEAERCRRRTAEAEAQLGEAQAEAAAVRKLATVRAQALVTTLKVMQASERRVSEAEAALQGEEGRGALVAALRELVGRRCQMVCQLGAIFQLGPTPVAVPEAPPGGFLEEQLERQWAGAADANGGAGFSSSYAGGGLTPYGSGAFGAGFGGGPLDSPSRFRQEMRLSVGGLELAPGVWRKAFDEGGYESDAAEDRAAGVALGYVAQIVDRLAAYLDVPLRYPLALRGSRSAVVDNHPPVGTWAEAEAEGGGSWRPFARSGGSGAGWEAAAGAAAPAGGGGGGAAAQSPVEYPLFCDSNRERPRFAVGVFLLNKDVIQLLQAHGISAAGPNHLLHNLHKLLLAAQSALPPPRLPLALGGGGGSSAAAEAVAASSPLGRR